MVVLLVVNSFRIANQQRGIVIGKRKSWVEGVRFGEGINIGYWFRFS
jgi:hypothetical protein